MASILSPADLATRLKNKQKLTLLDIRDSDEFSQWHIYGSLNIPFQSVRANLKKIPREYEIVVICNRGNDSKAIAKLLKNRGYKATSLAGGFKQWNTIYDISEVKAE